jgi:hypothetical protein
MNSRNNIFLYLIYLFTYLFQSLSFPLFFNFFSFLYVFHPEFIRCIVLILFVEFKLIFSYFLLLSVLFFYHYLIYKKWYSRY